MYTVSSYSFTLYIFNFLKNKNTKNNFLFTHFHIYKRNNVNVNKLSTRCLYIIRIYQILLVKFLNKLKLKNVCTMKNCQWIFIFILSKTFYTKKFYSTFYFHAGKPFINNFIAYILLWKILKYENKASSWKKKFYSLSFQFVFLLQRIDCSILV